MLKSQKVRFWTMLGNARKKSKNKILLTGIFEVVRDCGSFGNVVDCSEGCYFDQQKSSPNTFLEKKCARKSVYHCEN